MEYRKHTSLKDLAQALGVSIPTVSRALKDSPEISRELCAKAKQLAKDMNYRPNPFAMSLRKNAPRIIGVVVPDIVTHFFASILNRIWQLPTGTLLLSRLHMNPSSMRKGI